ncbi:MAG: NAD-dependent epimerase/dehydratase family protein [Betaproteobacteria bacterium]|nr:MAG: NAD-dependent epimerase/dehydratase family protein [Betaproteobacteria bacterium]
MKVAVTGASGFVGRTLGPALAAAGHETVPVESANAVVHLAAIAHRHASAEELRRVNVDLAVETARKAAAVGASFVFLSSVKVHGESSKSPFREGSPIAPQDIYAESKARAEQALRAVAGLRLAVLRPPLVYGPGVKANFLALMNAVARGVPLPLASIRNRRSLIYVGNLADAIIACLGKEGTYLVSDGEPVSTPQLVREIGEALGRPAHLLPFPTSFLPEKLSGSLELDDSHIRRTLGWKPPFTREQGLRRTAEWYRNRPLSNFGAGS